MERIQYKHIFVNQYVEYNILEFDISRNRIQNNEDFILKVSEFLEYIGFKSPSYVVFNKRTLDFEITKSLHKFAHHQVIDTLFEFGVKEIFFILTDERFLLYQDNIVRKNIHPFKSMDEVFLHINKK